MGGALSRGIKQPFDHVLHLLRPVLVVLLRVLGELDVGASTHQNNKYNITRISQLHISSFLIFDIIY